MSGPGLQVLRWLTETYRVGRPLVLLFDFDGTLVPYADHPDKVRLPAPTRQLLADLSARKNLFVGVISGRGLADIKEKVGLPDLYYAGSGGLELDLLGIRFDPPEADAGQEIVAELQAELDQAVGHRDGAWVERKPLGLAVHYRGLDAEVVPEFREAIRAILLPWRERTKVWELEKTFEIVPALGAGKATALQRIAEDAARDAVPFYAGDEANDADALELAGGMGGLAVGVGPHPPSTAQITLESPRALVQVLQRFSAVTEQTPSRSEPANSKGDPN